MIERQTHGPDLGYERTGAQLYRDARPAFIQFYQALKGPASGFILFALTIAIVVEPALIDLVVPPAVLYALWVLTRRVVLPLRLPVGAHRKDYNHPLPGKRRPRMAEGIVYIGQDYRTGQQLWLGNEDARQHVAAPGTTGAGKTEALISLAGTNGLTHTSGFIFVDGKADNKLFAKARALLRRAGREDCLYALNLIVASGNKDTNTWNPFAWGNADFIREMLISQIEANPRGGNSNGNEVFMARAVALMGALTPALVWIRDEKGVPIDIERIRFATELQSIAMLALEKRFRRLDVDSGIVEIIEVPEIPEALLYPLKAYLGETGGYDASLPYNQQKSDEPAKQHSFVTMHFSATFTQLAVSLGHIFKCEMGDIDMRDIVLNRRVLIVSLPSLENSGETTAALGKIVVAAVRNMMAQTLGSNLEGDYQEIVANTAAFAPSPYPVVFDEVGYYASPGMDKMIAQGRGLGFQFYLGFQEVASLRARIGESMYALLGNANFQILMRLQEGNETRRYVEQTAGETDVLQASSYQANDIGTYRQAQFADVRRTARVAWTDLRGLIEGEAIVLFGNRRIYAKLFHAEVDADGPMRLNRPLTLAPAAGANNDASTARLGRLREALIKGYARPDGDLAGGAAAKALVDAFAEAAEAGGGASACVEAAIAAAAAVVARQVPPAPVAVVPGEIPPAPPTELDPMLRSAGDHAASPSESDLVAAAPVTEADKQRDLARIEELAGAAAPEARIAAKEALGTRDMVWDAAALPPITRLSPIALRGLVEDLNADLESIAA